MLIYTLPVLSQVITDGCPLQSDVNAYQIYPCTCTCVQVVYLLSWPLTSKGQSLLGCWQAPGPISFHLFRVWSPCLLTYQMLLQQYAFFPESPVFPSPLDLSSEYQCGMWFLLMILKSFSRSHLLFQLYFLSFCSKTLERVGYSCYLQSSFTMKSTPTSLLKVCYQGHQCSPCC